jgi:hypothetical protein
MASNCVMLNDKPRPTEFWGSRYVVQRLVHAFAPHAGWSDARGFEDLNAVLVNYAGRTDTFQFQGFRLIAKQADGSYVEIARHDPRGATTQTHVAPTLFG